MPKQHKELYASINRIIVRPISPAEAVSGELEKVEKTTDVPEKGVVITFYYETELKPVYTWLKPGIIIYFKKWSGDDLTFEGKKYTSVALSEVIGYEA